MKNKGIILFFSVLLAIFFVRAEDSFSQEIKILKVKKNKAIIKFKGNLEKNKTYTVTSEKSAYDDEDFSKSKYGEASGLRDYSLGLDLSFQSTKSSVSIEGVESSVVDSTPSTTDLSVAVQFTFNLGGYIEVGPFLSFASSATAGISTSAYVIGLLGEFNFMKNEAGNSFVPGISVAVGYMGTSATGSTVNPSGLQATPLLQIKLFVLGNDTAIRIGLGYTYQSLAVETVSTVTSGFITKIGLIVYF